MKIKCPLIPLKGKPSQLEDTTASRDRIVVSTLRCGRSNPGSNPGHSNSVRSFKLLHAANKKPQGLAFTPIPGPHCLAILPASQSGCPLWFDRTALHSTPHEDACRARYEHFFPLIMHGPTCP